MAICSTSRPCAERKEVETQEGDPQVGTHLQSAPPGIRAASGRGDGDRWVNVLRAWLGVYKLLYGQGAATTSEERALCALRGLLYLAGTQQGHNWLFQGSD